MRNKQRHWLQKRRNDTRLFGLLKKRLRRPEGSVLVVSSNEHVSMRRTMGIFAGTGCYATPFGHPVNGVSKLAYQCRPYRA